MSLAFPVICDGPGPLHVLALCLISQQALTLSQAVHEGQSSSAGAGEWSITAAVSGGRGRPDTAACCQDSWHRPRGRSVTASAGGGSGGAGGAGGGRDPLLTVEGVAKTHDGEAVLFSDVSFTVHRGDRLAVVGPNGSGAHTSSLRTFPRWGCIAVTLNRVWIVQHKVAWQLMAGTKHCSAHVYECCLGSFSMEVWQAPRIDGVAPTPDSRLFSKRGSCKASPHVIAC
jgi:hypothetical protein